MRRVATLRSGRTLRASAWLLAILVLVLPQFPATLARAVAYAPGYGESLVADGIHAPTALEFAPDGRLFVLEQTGKVRVVKDGSLLPDEFVSLTVSSEGERGLLGIAFDPDFATNQHLFLYYTVPGNPAHNRVSRFTANGDKAAPASEQVILELNDLVGAEPWHNGGAIHFGPDGKLYIGTGENTIDSNSQSLNTLLGKILRINSDGSIPADNPFYTTATGQNRAIWALGLRNPFTFAFEPGTGRMFINDVGGLGIGEEVNVGVKGGNYGWPICEGQYCPFGPPPPGYQAPLLSYPRSSPTGDLPFGCAIVGAAFYNPPTPRYPLDLVHRYLFSDLCVGFLVGLDADSRTIAGLAFGISVPVDLTVGPDGYIYFLARGTGADTGAVYLLTYSSTQPPDTTPPAVTTVTPNDNATRVDPASAVKISFSEKIDPATVNAETIFLVEQGSNTPIPAQMTYDPITDTVYVKPQTPLASSAYYTVTVKGGADGVKDIADNPLANDYIWSFNTGLARNLLAFVTR